MKLRYYYSTFANLLFFIMGLAFLFVGIDLLVTHKFIRLSQPPPGFVSGIILFFGVMLSSGFIINLLKGRNYVLEADSKGITIFTKDINGALPEVFIPWKDVLNVEVRKARSTLGNSNNNRIRTLVIKTRPDLIKWPAVLISKNRIGFSKTAEYAEITIDAWLNKTKTKIAKEINELRQKH